MLTASLLRRHLDLQPHPEGGHFREIHRSAAIVTHPISRQPRSALTSIYFLLEEGEFSAFHRVRSDEIWNFHAGGPLELHLLDAQDGALRVLHLGVNVSVGEMPQVVVPAGCWQAARPVASVEFCLAGCQVAPGFDFADFEMPDREELLARFPRHRHRIIELTRPPSAARET